jgi:hypothetical protein
VLLEAGQRDDGFASFVKLHLGSRDVWQNGNGYPRPAAQEDHRTGWDHGTLHQAAVSTYALSAPTVSPTSATTYASSKPMDYFSATAAVTPTG